MDDLTRSIQGRCDGIRRRVDEVLGTAADHERDDRDETAGVRDGELVRQVEHAAADQVAAEQATRDPRFIRSSTSAAPSPRGGSR